MQRTVPDKRSAASRSDACRRPMFASVTTRRDFPCRLTVGRTHGYALRATTRPAMPHDHLIRALNLTPMARRAGLICHEPSALFARSIPVV